MGTRKWNLCLPYRFSPSLLTFLSLSFPMQMSDCHFPSEPDGWAEAPPPTPHHLDMSDRAGGSHGSGTLLHPYSRRQRGIYYLKHFLCSLYDWCDSWPQNSLLTFVTPPSCDREDNMAAKSWATHGSRAAPHQTCFCMCFKHWERFPHDLHHRKRFPVSADKQEVKQQPGRLQTSSWLSFRKLTELLSTNMNFAVVVLCMLASVSHWAQKAGLRKKWSRNNGLQTRGHIL